MSTVVSHDDISTHCICRNYSGQGSVTGRLSSLVRCSFANMSSYLRHDRASSVGFPRNRALWHWCGTLDCWVQLQTNLCQDWSFTITEKAPTSAFNNITDIQLSESKLTNAPVPYDLCIGFPFSGLFTVR